MTIPLSWLVTCNQDGNLMYKLPTHEGNERKYRFKKKKDITEIQESVLGLD